MADQLAAIVGGIANVTARLKSAAEDISLGSTDLARRTESQATFVEQTSNAMASLSSIVDVSTSRANDANSVAHDARQAARSSETRIHDAIDAMGRIQASSEQVTHIIGIIDEIAFQTNLLALNAAVEAARAGEAGKGFAVVATEVRTLAQRAADASHKISVLIGSAVKEVGGGVALVRKVGEDLQAIVASVTSFAELIGGIVDGNKEQSARLRKVVEALSAMDEVTRQNAVLVEQTGAAVEAQGQQADELHRMVRFFKTQETSPARLPESKNVALAGV